MLEAALDYAKRKWPIFPCRADKTPYTQNGVLDATTNLDQIKKWWTAWPMANIALDVGGLGWMVLDCDPGHKMAEITASIGELPPASIASRTPRGGKHLYYSLEKGEIVPPSASKIAPHVDVRSFHSYVLLPPSRTADGVYEWEAEAKWPGLRSQRMLDTAQQAREKHKDRDNWKIKPDLPENVELAITWLKTEAKPAIMGQGGDHIAYATAAMMKSYGISPELATDLMWEHWNSRCSPPWGPEELDHFEQKIENGYSYNTSPPGNMTPAYQVAIKAAQFKPVETKQFGQGKEVTLGRFRAVDRLAIESIRPPKWLIDNTIPEGGYVMLFGPSGSYKTFIAIDLGFSIATGAGTPEPWAPPDKNEWPGAWPKINIPGTVGYAAGEGRGMFKNRLTAWEKFYNRKVDQSRFVLLDPVPAPIEADWDEFVAVAEAMSPYGYSLLVLDTVGRSMQGMNENAQENASMFTKMVERLQRRLNCAVLAIHHSGHEKSDRARGSSVFGADVDVLLRTDAKKNSGFATLTMLKQKDAEEWNRPRQFEFPKILLPGGATSLVAKPGTVAVHVDNAETKVPSDHDPVRIGDAIRDLSAAIERVLSANPTKGFSDRQLAEDVACEPDVDISSSRIRHHYLKLLRENKSSTVRQYWRQRESPQVWRFK